MDIFSLFDGLLGVSSTIKSSKNSYDKTDEKVDGLKDNIKDKTSRIIESRKDEIKKGRAKEKEERKTYKHRHER